MGLPKWNYIDPSWRSSLPALFLLFLLLDSNQLFFFVAENVTLPTNTTAPILFPNGTQILVGGQVVLNSSLILSGGSALVLSPNSTIYINGIDGFFVDSDLLDCLGRF